MEHNMLDEDLVSLWDKLTGHSVLDAQEPKTKADYPLLPLRNQVLFPNVVTPLFVNRERSIKAVERAFAQKS